MKITIHSKELQEILLNLREYKKIFDLIYAKVPLINKIFIFLKIEKFKFIFSA